VVLVRALTGIGVFGCCYTKMVVALGLLVVYILARTFAGFLAPCPVAVAVGSVAKVVNVGGLQGC
jgi:hypothetical protein